MRIIDLRVSTPRARRFYEQDMCDKVKSYCYWHEGHVCVTVGKKPPCHVYNDNKDVCEKQAVRILSRLCLSARDRLNRQLPAH